MPARVRKVKGGYQVRTNGVTAKKTSLRKAKSQQRLLNAIESGNFKPTKKRKR